MGASARKKSSVYRGRRALKGFRRVEAMLAPEAVGALKKLTEDGTPQSIAIAKAVIAAAKNKR